MTVTAAKIVTAHRLTVIAGHAKAAMNVDDPTTPLATTAASAKTAAHAAAAVSVKIWSPLSLSAELVIAATTVFAIVSAMTMTTMTSLQCLHLHLSQPHRGHPQRLQPRLLLLRLKRFPPRWHQKYQSAALPLRSSSLAIYAIAAPHIATASTALLAAIVRS